jgi:hypothetical protein
MKLDRNSERALRILGTLDELQAIRAKLDSLGAIHSARRAVVDMFVVEDVEQSSPIDCNAFSLVKPRAGVGPHGLSPKQ